MEISKWSIVPIFMKIEPFGRYVEIILISKNLVFSHWNLFFGFQAFSFNFSPKIFCLRDKGALGAAWWISSAFSLKSEIYLRGKSVDYMVLLIIQEWFEHRPTCFGTTEWILFDKRGQNLCFETSIETPRRLWRDWKFSKSWLLLLLL